MARVLVVYGSRHGATRGIAERIGETLRAAGCAADVEAADMMPDIRGADGVVVGSAVYMGSWLTEPLEFLRRHQAELATRPLWLFSSGPLAGSTAEKRTVDPITDALGRRTDRAAAGAGRSPN